LSSCQPQPAGTTTRLRGIPPAHHRASRLVGDRHEFAALIKPSIARGRTLILEASLESVDALVARRAIFVVRIGTFAPLG
jgi:hypothetical protein